MTLKDALQSPDSAVEYLSLYQVSPKMHKKLFKKLLENTYSAYVYAMYGKASLEELKQIRNLLFSNVFDNEEVAREYHILIENKVFNNI